MSRRKAQNLQVIFFDKDIKVLKCNRKSLQVENSHYSIPNVKTRADLPKEARKEKVLHEKLNVVKEKKQSLMA